jgi:4a-hydroxytetrahydrobiopterin dehydratase
MPDQCLIHKSCVPCRGDGQILEDLKISPLLKELGDGWTMNKKGHLYKEYLFSNFVEAINFANSVGKLAEEEGHHPVLSISWGICSIEIWTHKMNALTESDFILASKINLIGVT